MSFKYVISKSKIYNLNYLAKKECAVEVVVAVSFQTLNDIAYHISSNKPGLSKLRFLISIDTQTRISATF